MTSCVLFAFTIRIGLFTSCFEDAYIPMHSALSRVLASISDGSYLDMGHMFNTLADLFVMRKLEISGV